MTNELEKQFFDTFGIEAIKYCKRCCWCKIEETTFGDYDMCLKPESGKCNCVYPTISDRILLELICIGTQFFAELVLLTSDNIEDLKEQVLTIYLKTAYKENLKHQVRTLFEEG